jgi:hypothetical protein
MIDQGRMSELDDAQIRRFIEDGFILARLAGALPFL